MPTKNEIQEALDAASDILKGISKAKSLEFLGQFNLIFLTLEKVKRVAPE